MSSHEFSAKNDHQGNVLVGWVLTLLRAMQSEGVELDDIINDIDLDINVLVHGGNRVSQNYVDSLWTYASRKIADPVFGLRVAKHVRPSSFHVVGQAMAYSTTLHRALYRFSQFCRIISQSATATLVDQNTSVALEFYFDPGKNPPSYRSYDVVLAMVLNLAREIAGRCIEPLEVHFASPIASLPAPYHEFFNCPIFFDIPQSKIVFSKSDLYRPILGADERLASILDDLAKNELAVRMEGRFTTRVRDALMLQFTEGPPSPISCI